MLTCSCDWNDDYAYYYEGNSDYMALNTKRSRKCCSCKSRIAVGETTVKFHRWRPYKNDIEERIHGDEVPMSSLYQCERCADLYFSFEELGFECVSPEENMLELIKEYAATYGPNRRIEEPTSDDTQ